MSNKKQMQQIDLGRVEDQTSEGMVKLYDPGAEQCVLASLMLAAGDDALFQDTAAGLRPESFGSGDHAEIYQALLAMKAAGQPIDAVLLREELIRRGRFKEVGGMPYLATILSSIPDASHGPQYADIVRRLAAKRHIVATAHEAIKRASDPGFDPAEVQQWLGESMADLHVGSEATRILTHEEVLHNALAEVSGGGAPLLKTGLEPLDEAIGGLGIGEVTIIAARPSMGKSLLGKQLIASAAVKHGTRGGFVSVEERASKIGRNFLSAWGEVPNWQLRQGKLLAEQERKLGAVLSRYATLPLFYNDTASEIEDVASVIATMARKHGAKLVLVDYLQLISARGFNTREQEVAAVSRTLKNLAKRLEIALVVLAQLNRGNEREKDIRPPRMSDLRESGQIEQDADTILLLHRPDYYGRDLSAEGQSYTPNREVHVIMGKTRDSVRGQDVILHSELDFQRFVPKPAAPPTPPPPQPRRQRPEGAAVPGERRPALERRPMF